MVVIHLFIIQRSRLCGSKLEVVSEGWRLEAGRGPATLTGMSQCSPFRYFRTSPEIIRLAVMLYVRFPLSLRNVEDLLHERGIEISHETVRFWWQRFGPMFAAEIRKRRVGQMRTSRWRWHLDEVFVKVNGVQHYLWRPWTTRARYWKRSCLRHGTRRPS